MVLNLLNNQYERERGSIVALASARDERVTGGEHTLLTVQYNEELTSMLFRGVYYCCARKVG